MIIEGRQGSDECLRIVGNRYSDSIAYEFIVMDDSPELNKTYRIIKHQHPQEIDERCFKAAAPHHMDNFMGHRRPELFVIKSHEQMVRYDDRMFPEALSEQYGKGFINNRNKGFLSAGVCRWLSKSVCIRASYSWVSW